MNQREIERLQNQQLIKSEIAELVGKYKARIIETLQKALESKRPDPAYYERRMEEIRKTAAVMANKFESYLNKRMTDYYSDGKTIGVKQLQSMGFDLLQKARVPTTQLQRIIQDSVSRFIEAQSEGLLQIEDIFRNTQQAALTEIQINRAIAEGIVMQPGPRQQAKYLADAIKKQLNGQLLVINGRNYNPDSYAELVVRTRGREAQSAGAADSLREYGVDTVRISDHHTTTEICQHYEGNIYSLDGKTPGYDILPQMPPYHPNCKHVMYPYIPRGEKRTLEENRRILEELAR